MLFSQFYKSKDQKYYKNWTKEAVFVYILAKLFKESLVLLRRTRSLCIKIYKTL